MSVQPVAKRLNDIRKETTFNENRQAENFPLPQRSIQDFDVLHPYLMDFMTKPNTGHVYLDLYFRERPTPCSINPPNLGVTCTTSVVGSNPGYFVGINSSSVLDEINEPPNPDFYLEDGQIVLPVDGCYSVEFVSGAYGPSYFYNKTVVVNMERNGYTFRRVEHTATGVLVLIGPGIYFYTPASPVYGVVDAKAGDKIIVRIGENGIADSYPWLNGGLNGFFYNPGSPVTVTLIAKADK